MAPKNLLTQANWNLTHPLEIVHRPYWSLNRSSIFSIHYVTMRETLIGQSGYILPNFKKYAKGMFTVAKLHFYYSAMNAGKSTVLLQSSYNYNERGMDTLLYTPVVDDRFGVGKIASRIGLQRDAISMEKDFDIFVSVKKHIAENPNVHCVLIDEAQFLTKKQVEQLTFV